MKIVKEKSTNETSKYLKELESRMGFPIRMIQVDNGPEFVNDGERTELESAFEKTANIAYVLAKDKTLFSMAEWESRKKPQRGRQDLIQSQGL